MIKNSEVFKADFDNLWVVSKLFKFDSWVKINEALELFFDSKVILNPLFADNALIESERGPLKEFIDSPGKWQYFGAFHLKFEKWNNLIHGRPIYSIGYGWWITIKNLPLDYFGGLDNIAAETINFLNVSKAKIQVKENK